MMEVGRVLDRRCMEGRVNIFKVQTSAGKVIAGVFWHSEGLLLLELLKRGATISSKRYLHTSLLPGTARSKAWVCGRSLCWNCGFEFHQGHGCVSVEGVVCCQVEVCVSG